MNEKKDQIVRATVDCITKYGYHNFSMQDVARVAGVSKGIIHYYFLNKDRLMISVLDKVADNIERALLAQMEKSRDPVEKIKVFVRGYFEITQKTRGYYQVHMDFLTQINQKKEIREIILKHYQNFRQAAIDVIEQGKDLGCFKPVDSQFYACYIIAILDGISLQWLFGKQALNCEKIVQKSLDLLVLGLQA